MVPNTFLFYLLLFINNIHFDALQNLIDINIIVILFTLLYDGLNLLQHF